MSCNSNQFCERTDLFGISCFCCFVIKAKALCCSLLPQSQHIHLSTTAFSVFSREGFSLVILRCHTKFRFCWHFPDFLGFKTFSNEVLKQMMTMCFYAYITNVRVIPDQDGVLAMYQKQNKTKHTTQWVILVITTLLFSGIQDHSTIKQENWREKSSRGYFIIKAWKCCFLLGIFNVWSNTLNFYAVKQRDLRRDSCQM